MWGNCIHVQKDWGNGRQLGKIAGKIQILCKSVFDKSVDAIQNFSLPKRCKT